MSYSKYARKLTLVEEKDSNFEVVKITNSKSANDYVRKFYFDDINIYESMFLIGMNNKNKIQVWAKISQGGIAGTVADIRIMFKYAIESLCTTIMIVHNHPSGDPNPSKADKELTDRIKDAGKFLDIQLLDHLIVCDDNKYFSFADEGLI